MGMGEARLRALVERAMGRPVARLVADTLGGSNAVYFLDLADGGRCVLRVSPVDEGALVAREAWAVGAARAVGAPAPEVLAIDLSLRHLDRPYLLMRRLPGAPAFRAPLAGAAGAALLAQLGAILGRLHRIPLGGFGPPSAAGDTYRGAWSSWWGYLHAEGHRRLARLPGGALDPHLARRVAGHLDRAVAWPAPGPAVLVHGDYQLKNVLARDGRVTGLVDFENLVAGDPLLDFAPLCYWSRAPWRTLAALARGYGRAPLADPGAAGRLALYEALLALEIRWWEVHLGLPAARRDAHAQLERALRTLDERSGARWPRAGGAAQRARIGR